MIVLEITVVDIADKLAAGFDQIKIYRDVSQFGTFTQLIGIVELIADQKNYKFVDSDGASTHWYKVSFYATATSTEDEKSEAFQGVDPWLPLGLVDVDYVRSNTDISDLVNLSDAKLVNLISRAESYVDRWGQRHGGFDTGKSGFTAQMRTAILLVIEEMYFRNEELSRRRIANNYTRERIGSYEYSVGSNRGANARYPEAYFTQEVLDILSYFVNGTNTILISTTQVFPELKPDLNNRLTPNSDVLRVRPYHDWMDGEIDEDTGYPVNVLHHRLRPD